MKNPKSIRSLFSLKVPRWWTLGLVSGLLVLGSPFVAGADGEISPDRASLTSNTRTVRPGVIQIETGVEYSESRLGGGESDRRFAVQLTLRTGLTNALEARLEGEPFVQLRGESDDTGPGDITLRLKYRFLDAVEGEGWPSLGLQPSVKLPVAGAPIGTGRPDFALLALASVGLPARFELDVNAGLAAVGQSRPNGYLLQALTSASLSWEILQGASAFMELAFASRNERDKRDTVDVKTGIVYLLTKDVALDFAGGTSLAGQGPDYTVTAGVSVRLGR